LLGRLDAGIVTGVTGVIGVDGVSAAAAALTAAGGVLEGAAVGSSVGSGTAAAVSSGGGDAADVEVVSAGGGSMTTASRGRESSTPAIAPPMATVSRPPTMATIAPEGPLVRATGGAGAMAGTEKGNVAIT
jgi:hypothetical protein